MVWRSSFVFVCVLACGCGARSTPPQSGAAPLPSLALKVVGLGTLEGAHSTPHYHSLQTKPFGATRLEYTASDSSNSPVARYTALMPYPDGPQVEVRIELEARQRVRFSAGEGLKGVTLARGGQVLGQGDGAVTVELDPGSHDLLLRGELPHVTPAQEREFLLRKALASMTRAGKALANVSDANSARNATEVLRNETKPLKELRQKLLSLDPPEPLDDEQWHRLRGDKIAMSLQEAAGFGISNKILDENDSPLPPELRLGLEAARDEYSKARDAIDLNKAMQGKP